MQAFESFAFTEKDEVKLTFMKDEGAKMITVAGVAY